MFINYFADPDRETFFNFSIARILIGIFALVKVLSIDWSVAAEWPVFLYDNYTFLIPFEGYLEYLPYEAGMVIGLLVCFTIGYRTGVTSFLSALLIAHISGIYFMIHNSGTIQMFLFDIYLLVLFGIYRHVDRLSVDSIRRTKHESLSELNEFLQSNSHGTIRLLFFKWLLLTLALTYFFSGYAKIVHGPVWEWVTADSMARLLKSGQVLTARDFPVGDFLIAHPSLTFLAALGTVVLETGFVFAVLAGWPIWLFVIGLIGMHTVIAITMSPFFWNYYVMFALFLPYDRLFARIESDRYIDIVYDESCYFCARTLTVFERLDVNDTIRFYSQSTVPDRYTDFEDTEFEGTMCAFVDGERYRGYDAFIALLAHYRITLPLVLVMRLPRIRRAGERVYAYITANCHRYFDCSLE